MSGVHSIHYPTITANMLRVCQAKAPFDLVSNEKFLTVLLKIFQEDHDLLSTSNVFEALRILTSEPHENKLQTLENLEKVRIKFANLDGFLNRCRKFIVKSEYEDEQLGQKIFQNAQIILDRLANYEKIKTPNATNTPATTQLPTNPTAVASAPVSAPSSATVMHNSTFSSLPSATFIRQPLASLTPLATTNTNGALKASSTHCLQLKVCGYNGSEKHKALLENCLQKITGVVSFTIGTVPLGDIPNCIALSVYTTARPQLILRNVLDSINKITIAAAPTETIFKVESLPVSGLATPAAPKLATINNNNANTNNGNAFGKNQSGIVAVDSESRQSTTAIGYSSTLSRFMSGATRFFVGAK